MRRMRVKSIMSTGALTAALDDTVQDLLRILAQYSLSGLPVINRQNQLAGFVSRSDADAREGEFVRDIMTPHVWTIDPEMEIERAAVLLAEYHVKRLPVLDNGRLVGIISRSDIINMKSGWWSCGICGALSAGLPPEQCEMCGADASEVYRTKPDKMEFLPQWRT